MSNQARRIVVMLLRAALEVLEADAGDGGTLHLADGQDPDSRAALEAQVAIVKTRGDAASRGDAA